MNAFTLNTADQTRLDNFLVDVENHSKMIMGYPTTRDLDCSDLTPFMNYALNNVGDPFIESTSKTNSREFEQDVLKFWAELMNAPTGKWWGYVTNGGTEGNLYGLYLARELYPKGIVYFSQDTHYSVTKNLNFLNMRNIMIRSQANGEMDYDDLYETIKVNRDAPPIIFANIGTTMTEAKDDIKRIKAIFKALAIPQHYIHSDAALCGGIAPFLSPKPHFDFADGADSISISGHKFLGSPIPCGIVLARKEYVNRIARSISYIGTLDTTITGSRNGLTPLILWYAMRTMGKEGLALRTKQCLENAAYAEKRLRAIGIDAWRNPNAITVVMPEVPVELKAKWQLATAQGISHIIIMPSVSKDMIDGFINDMATYYSKGATA